MGYATVQAWAAAVWGLAGRQHGVVAHWQLVELGMHPQAIKHRVKMGRLHRLHRGVYAVGRPEVTQHGRWMAAVLACGLDAALSHGGAAAVWGIQASRATEIEVSVPARRNPRHPGITVHRERHLDVTTRHGIPVTTPLATLIALATREPRNRLEAAINEADKLDLIDPETLRRALDQSPTRPGSAILRRTLDSRTFTLTDTELERRFLPLARKAGLPKPQTQRWVNGFKVDFYWPDLGLVVETDGLRYHRTPAQQTEDRIRDQAHTAAGLTPLRFTRAQVRYEPGHVQATLTAVARRLRAG